MALLRRMSFILIPLFILLNCGRQERDFPTPPALVTVERDGQMIDAVAQPSKYGNVLVFDRETGESLFPLKEINVPPSDVEGEVLSETQIMPLEPQPFARGLLQKTWLPAVPLRSMMTY